jgi:soluble lytic murein transglycosylase-like protein
LFKLFFVCALFATQLVNAQSSSVDAQRSAADRQRQQTMDAMTKSISTQMNAIRASRKIAAREATPAAFFVLDPELQPASASTGPACDPMSAIAAQGLASKAAAANQISPELVFSVMRRESAFLPCAVSDKGALGLMQLMPETAMQLGVIDPLDAEQNVLGGAKYLRELFARYSGDLNKTLGAYNAGPGRVDDYDGVPPFPETLNYVDSILNSLQPAKH